MRAARNRPLSGATVSYGLLKIKENPTAEEVCRFEDVSLVLRTSNGTWRTTFRQRMSDVDAIALDLLQHRYPQDAHVQVQDRGASNCLTSAEWAKKLFLLFPHATLEASDRLLHLLHIALAGERAYIIEPEGEPLQYLHPPFVVFLGYINPYRYPLRRLIAGVIKRSFRKLDLPKQCSAYRVDQICCIHPEAKSLRNIDSRFQICTRSVFAESPGMDVLRTMNILNRNYFPRERLLEGANAAFRSLKPGGLWIVGRTLENQTNHATFFRRTEKKWEAITRIGNGSEIEELIS